MMIPFSTHHSIVEMAARGVWYDKYDVLQISARIDIYFCILYMLTMVNCFLFIISRLMADNSLMYFDSVQGMSMT